MNGKVMALGRALQPCYSWCLEGPVSLFTASGRLTSPLQISRTCTSCLCPLLFPRKPREARRTGAGVGARGHGSASPQLPLELCPRKSHSQAGIPCVTLLTELLPSPLCLSLNALLTDRLCPEHYPWPHS